MKRILAATDLSVRSDRALQRALALADEFHAELEVVHIVDDSLPEAIRRQHAEAAVSSMNACLASLSRDRTAKFAARVIHDQDYTGIINRAEEIGADLVVLGIHRHAALEAFRGTTAERVVRFGGAPVLMVRDPVAGPYRRVVVPADLSLHARAALRLAARLAPQGEIHIVHATHAPFKGFLGRGTLRQIVKDEQAQFTATLKEDLDCLSAELGEEAPRIEIVLREGPVELVVRDQIALLRPDLLAIGAHSRTGVAYAILGSVAEGLLANPPTDILIGKAS